MLSQITAIVIAYFITSLWETFIHWRILHATKGSRRIWRKFGVIGSLLRRAYFSHNIIHHNKTFKDNLFIQFKNKKEQLSLDNKLPQNLRIKIQENKYGLTISTFWEMITFTLFPITINTLIFYRYANIITLVIITFISILPALLSRYLHPKLHQQIQNHTKQNNLFCIYFRYIQDYHLTHHRSAMVNFNLLPGGDYILGVNYKNLIKR